MSVQGTRGVIPSMDRVAASSRDHGASVVTSERVLSEAAGVALAATHLVIVWHAGALSGEQAMHLLAQAVAERGWPSAAASRKGEVSAATAAPHRREGSHATPGCHPPVMREGRR
ncbi:MAG: hypothetical protein IVW52_17930 [Acidimicrobiales bacterium]|nr:hypothetical protein [Acidimicrobiales bacterium]